MDEINMHVTTEPQTVRMSVSTPRQNINMGVLAGGSEGSGGDMYMAIYDRDMDGVVDNAAHADEADNSQKLDGLTLAQVVDYCGGVNLYTYSIDIPQNTPLGDVYIGGSSGGFRVDREYRVINAWLDRPEQVTGWAEFSTEPGAIKINCQLRAASHSRFYFVIADASTEIRESPFDSQYRYVFYAASRHALSDYENDIGYMRQQDIQPLIINGTTYDGSESVEINTTRDIGLMQKSEYDADNDGMVDAARVALGLTDMARDQLYDRLQLRDQQVWEALGYIPADENNLPTALPCPQPLTINGTTYDGSSPVDMFISGDGSGYLPNGQHSIGHVILSGFISTSSSRLQVMLPMPALDTSKGYSVSIGGSISVRGVTGYIYSTTGQSSSTISENVAKQCSFDVLDVNRHSLIIGITAPVSWYQASSSTKATNNTPICIVFNSLTVTVSDASAQAAAAAIEDGED